MNNKTIIGIMIFLLLAVPFAFAQDNAMPNLIATANTTAATAKEYTGWDQLVDNIKLIFTFNEQKKASLINLIEQRREQHYNFLIAKGKTEQAEKFKNQTIGIVKNFEQWKAKRNLTIQRFENRTRTVGEKVENLTKRLENRSNTIEERMQNRTQEIENRTANIQQKTTEREQQIRERNNLKNSSLHPVNTTY